MLGAGKKLKFGGSLVSKGPDFSLVFVLLLFGVGKGLDFGTSALAKGLFFT